MTRILQLLAIGATTACPLVQAYSPGDLMILGLDSDPNPDSFSFVTWVEIPDGDTILFFDAEYDGGGDGSGEGSGGGLYASMRQIEWTNNTGSPIAAGTVIPITGLTNSAAATTVGSVSGGFAITNGGEQVFIADGSFTASGGDDYFDGDLIFGFDFEGSGAWGESGESELPSALNVPGGNLSFAHEDFLEYDGARSGLPIGDYPAEVLDVSNWGFIDTGFDTTPFVDSGTAAYLPGELMFVGWNTNSPDSLSFVSWVDIPNGESFLFVDAEYDGGGDGSGKGIGGGYYASPNTMTWTNTEGIDLPAGTVVVVTDMSNGSSTPNLGSTSGGFALTNQGEQMFIAQGDLLDDSGNMYFEGDLIFGVDFEGDVGWGESGESQLPQILNVSAGNLSFGDQPAYEYAGARDGSPVSSYAALALEPSNWQAITATAALDPTSFVETVIPPVVVPDQLGQVNDGLLFHTRRMNNKQPILDETWSLAQGASSSDSDNLNGPSCVRLPSWLAAGDRVDPTAEYYLYFADHSGDYIRMAWAPALEGPWTGYNMSSSLDLIDRGVLSLGSDGIISPGNQIEVNGHIASPQVFVDDVNQQFLMYYHGPTDHNGVDRGQSTLAAISPYGLNFNMPGADGGVTNYGTIPVILGESYFKVFQQAGNFYAFSNTGDIWECPDPANPLSPPGGYDYSRDYWDRGPDPFNNETESRGFVDWGGGYGSLRPRHFGVLTRGGNTYAFFTNKAGSPERIKVSTFDFDDLPSDYEAWKGDFPNQELIRPEEVWEGGALPIGISESGSSNSAEHELRDPGIFEDTDGRTYMFYSGSGEKAIGLAQIVSLPEISGTSEVTTGDDETYSISTDIDVTPSMMKISSTTPVTLEFGAEDGEPVELVHAGNTIDHEQSSTVNVGAYSYRLAHDASGQSATLTFPDHYYARPGTTLEFNSQMGSSTTGQFAEVQVSFDGTVWQTMWILQGGTTEALFSKVSVDMTGMAGRTFQLRFRYIHETVRNASFESGTSSGKGWFIDQVVATGLESVSDIYEAPFTGSSFTLDEITPILDPHLAAGTEEEDRFLICVDALHSGTGFSEATGYGKPFVIRVRDSYEDFLADNFTPTEQEDELISGENADPDGDGFVNLVEHGFGTDPNVANVQPVGIANAPGASPDPSISFTWNPDAGYGYELEMSTTLAADFVSIPYTEELTPNGDLVDVVLKPAPSVSLGDRAFFRLNIPTP